MRAIAAAGAVLLLAVAGCDSPQVRGAKAAEQRLRMLQTTHPTVDALCRAQREVRDAWLQALDQQKFQEWDLRSGATCLEAQLDALGS